VSANDLRVAREFLTQTGWTVREAWAGSSGSPASGAARSAR
jgi:hypothetical protein